MCVHVDMTDLTQPLSSLETQWSHLISHASDALMNQHTPACQQRGVVVKYTGMHFSQNCYLKHGKYSCVLSDKDGANVEFLDDIKQIFFFFSSKFRTIRGHIPDISEVFTGLSQPEGPPSQNWQRLCLAMACKGICGVFCSMSVLFILFFLSMVKIGSPGADLTLTNPPAGCDQWRPPGVCALSRIQLFLLATLSTPWFKATRRALNIVSSRVHLSQPETCQAEKQRKRVSSVGHWN